MKVPFLNLSAQYESISGELDSAIRNAIASFRFIRGKEVSDFENSFKNLLGVNHCISTGNGTDALFIALKSLGIKTNDEVIIPAFTWISASEVVSLCGAKPVFADIDAKTYTIDISQIEKKITSRTKAVIVVHLYGQAAHISDISKLCHEKNIMLIEDCAQAHLTVEGNKAVGTFGTAGTFSFYPTKNLGAYGDSGCVVTDNNSLGEKIRRFANHGALDKDDHEVEGMNSRMDTLQAAVLLAKLPFLKQWNKQRLQHAQLYTELLSEEENVVVPFVRPNTNHTFHIYAIRAKKREELRQHLFFKGVQTLVHYPKSLPNLPAYRHLQQKPEEFPVADALENEILSLPVYPELKDEEISYVCQRIKEFYKKEA